MYQKQSRKQKHLNLTRKKRIGILKISVIEKVGTIGSGLNNKFESKYKYKLLYIVGILLMPYMNTIRTLGLMLVDIKINNKTERGKTQDALISGKFLQSAF